MMRKLSLLLLLGAFSAMPDSADSFIQTFESKLIERRIEFKALDDGRYDIESDSEKMTVALDNLSRQFARDQNAAAVVGFLDSVLGRFAPLPD